MLRQAGIDSLEAMAKADADRLRLAMGLVGELLDLRYWIDCAQDLTRGSGTAARPGRVAKAGPH